jgi:hypothetical protein
MATSVEHNATIAATLETAKPVMRTMQPGFKAAAARERCKATRMTLEVILEDPHVFLLPPLFRRREREPSPGLCFVRGVRVKFWREDGQAALTRADR